MHAGVAAGLYTYNIKVVPTSYQTKDKKITESNQYSASDTFFPMDPQWIPHAGIPGIMFFYDMSAIKVSASASRNRLIFSKCDPESSPEYSYFLYLYVNHW